MQIEQSNRTRNVRNINERLLHSLCFRNLSMLLSYICLQTVLAFCHCRQVVADVIIYLQEATKTVVLCSQ